MTTKLRLILTLFAAGIFAQAQTPDSLAQAPDSMVQTPDSLVLNLDSLAQSQTPDTLIQPVAPVEQFTETDAKPDSAATAPDLYTEDDEGGIPLDVPMQKSKFDRPKRSVASEGVRNTRALAKADDLFRKKAYAEAIPYYEKARSGDSANVTLLANLAECYRMTNNSVGKLHSYGALVRSGSAQSIQLFYYAQALQELGESDEAKRYYEKYDGDIRGKNLASSYLKRNAYTRNADAYSIFAASFNSPFSDMCAVRYNDAIVFCSARRRNHWIRRDHGWTNSPFMQIFVAGLGAGGEEVTPQLFMSDLHSKFNDGPVSFSADFNTVYFTRNNLRKEERAADGLFKLKIMEARLDQNGFSMVKDLPFVEKEHNYAHPSISPDGYTLYFASDIEGGRGGMDIYKCKKDSAGNWGEPENLGEILNTPGNEVFPFIASNGVLYFSSDGHDGLGGLDIYETRMKDGKPAKIYNMGEPINGNRDDFGIFLNDDNKSGFISSNRKAGGTDDDVYNLQILREVKRGKDVTLRVTEKNDSMAIEAASIVFNGDTLLTNGSGEVKVLIEEGEPYTVQVMKSEYFTNSDSLSTAMSEEDSFTKEITIEKDPKLFLRGLVTDSKTGEPLEGVTVKITDLSSGTEIDEYTTTASGDYFKFMFDARIGDRLAYLIKMSSPGYLERTMVFTYTIEKPGEININETLNMSLGKVAVGMDLAKMIDIKPIYFDFGKSDIRQDAADELDKIVAVMNEYPNMFIELGSHTDCRSSKASNLKLSTARARSSVNYIVKRGISKSRINAKGYGESRLLNNCACEGKVQSNCSEEEHAMNRRTEFIITRLK